MLKAGLRLINFSLINYQKLIHSDVDIAGLPPIRPIHTQFTDELGRSQPEMKIRQILTVEVAICLAGSQHGLLVMWRPDIRSDIDLCAQRIRVRRRTNQPDTKEAAPLPMPCTILIELQAVGLIHQHHIDITITVIVETSNTDSFRWVDQPPVLCTFDKTAITIVNKQPGRNATQNQICFLQIKLTNGYLLIVRGDIFRDMSKAIDLENIDETIIVEVSRTAPPTPGSISNVTCLRCYIFET